MDQFPLDRATANRVCGICHANVPSNCQAVLKCRHTYHLKCIKPWLKHNRTCPTCRRRVGRIAVYKSGNFTRADLVGTPQSGERTPAGLSERGDPDYVDGPPSCGDDVEDASDWGSSEDNAELDQLRSRNQALENDLERANAELRRQKEQSTEYNTEAFSLSDKLAQEQHRNRELEALVVQNRTEILELKGALKKSHVREVQHEKDYARVKQESATLRLELASLRTEHKAIHEAWRRAEQGMHQAQLQVQELKDEQEELSNSHQQHVDRMRLKQKNEMEELQCRHEAQFKQAVDVHRKQLEMQEKQLGRYMSEQLGRYMSELLNELQQKTKELADSEASVEYKERELAWMEVRLKAAFEQYRLFAYSTYEAMQSVIDQRDVD